MDNQEPQQKQRLNIVSNLKKTMGKFQPIVLLGLASVVLLIGAGLYGYTKRSNTSEKTTATDSTTQTQNEPHLTLDQQIDKVQNEILKGSDNFKLRFELAKLYHAKGNKNKAIFNYEKAKAFALPTDESYVANVFEINTALRELREGQ